MIKRIFNLNGDNTGYISDATIHNGVAYLAGQMSIDPVTTALKPGTMNEEASLALDNLLNVVKGLGASIEDVLFVNVYITDMKELPEFNQVYTGIFKENPPARAGLCVKELYGGLKVEVTAIVAVDK